MDTPPILTGLVLALAASYAAYRAGMLDTSGAVAATGLGTIVLVGGGWRWAVLLMVFFLTSSSLSRAFKARKREYAEDYAKGDRRDAGQVAANGAAAAAFVAMHLAVPEASWPWIGFAAALAAANADTWGTELGVLSRSRPRLVTDLHRRVEPGTSGAVSVAGTIAAFGGSVLIAASVRVLDPALTWSPVIAIAVGGLAGAGVDSVLGATVQAIYFCPVDQRETEKHPLHGCGSATTLVRGWRWLDNDRVNAACTATGALVACLLSAAIAV